MPHRLRVNPITPRRRIRQAPPRPIANKPIAKRQSPKIPRSTATKAAIKVKRQKGLEAVIRAKREAFSARGGSSVPMRLPTPKKSGGLPAVGKAVKKAVKKVLTRPSTTAQKASKLVGAARRRWLGVRPTTTRITRPIGRRKKLEVRPTTTRITRPIGRRKK